MGFELFVTPRSWPGGVRGAIESAAPEGAERVKYRTRSCLNLPRTSSRAPAHSGEPGPTAHLLDPKASFFLVQFSIHF